MSFLNYADGVEPAGDCAVLPAAEVSVDAGAVALPGEVVLVDTLVATADDSAGPEDADVVGRDDTVKPPPDTDVG